MYAITAIVILPINSAINPLIYSSVPDILRERFYNPVTSSISTRYTKSHGPRGEDSQAVKTVTAATHHKTSV